jgi:CheY-like chemotaxis protein
MSNPGSPDEPESGRAFHAGDGRNEEPTSAKVLVVDDTEHVKRMLVDMLELDGFDVVGQASTGREGLDLALEREPDVVVMDYKMDGMDGLAAARAIRSAAPSQAIILYTAYMDPSLETHARAAGVALCVEKAEGINRLERHIIELCRDFR